MSQIKIKKEAFDKSPFFISYFITDPDEYGSTVTAFEQSLRSTLSQHHIDIVCFRDKTSPNKKELAKVFLDICREFNIKKVLINSDLSLCEELGFDGIHLNSLQFETLLKINKKKLFTIISCHTEDEIVKAKEFNANAITYSPIFFKEFKGEPKGIANLKRIVKKYQNEDFHIYGLGGIITKNNVLDIQKTNAKGFASIRYFKI